MSEREARPRGSVRSVSYLPETAEAGGEGTSTDAIYSAYVTFTPDDTTRLGMTVIVTVPEDEMEETEATDAETPEVAAEEEALSPTLQCLPYRERQNAGRHMGSIFASTRG